MSQKLKLLMVEDRPEDAELTLAALEEAGYSCDWERVETEADFLSKLKSPDYDLVLSDYSLPTFDGLTALKLFKKLDLDIPFILVSGTFGEETAIESIMAGATDYVLKDKLFRLPFVVKRALREAYDQRLISKAEKRLKVQASALEAAGNAIVITEPNGTITWVNSAFTKLTGYSPKEAIGKNPRILKSGKHNDRFFKNLWDTIISGQTWHGEIVNRRKDGTTYVEEQTITPVLNEVDEITNFIAIKQDVSERRKIEEETKAARARFEAVFKAAPGSLLLATYPDGKIVEVNDNFFEITGYSISDVIGKNTLDLNMWVDSAARDRFLELIAKDGAVTNFEADLRHRSGVIRNGIVGGNLISILNNKYLLGVFEDVTAHKRDEAERRVIFEIIRSSTVTRDLDEFLKFIHGLISELIYADNCFVMLHDPSTDTRDFVFWVDEQDGPPVPSGATTGFGNYVLRTGKPLLLNDDLEASLIAAGEADHVGTPALSWLGAPLRTPSGTIGVLVVQHYKDEHVYNQRDLEFLTSVGDQIALAIERKRSEKAMQRSEERYRDLVEKAHDIIFTQDLAGNYLSANGAVEQILGYTVEEALSLNMADIMPPAELKKGAALIAEKLAGAEVTTAELDLIAKDGHTVTLDVNTRLVHEDGVAVGIQGIARDITERKRAEERLRAETNLLNTLIDNLPDRIFVKDLESRLILSNPAHRQRLGAETINDVVGKTDHDFFPAEVAVNYKADEARVMLTGESIINKEEANIDRDGNKGWSLTTKVPLRDADGNILGIVGINHDITERKALEDQYRQAQKMEAIGVLAGGVAHDFNNLLTAINGYADLSLRKLPAGDPLRGNIEEIRKAGGRAADLTSQLLIFSRKQGVEPRIHNLNSVIVDFEKMLRRVITESIVLRTILDPDLANINADPGQMEQIIMNLAINARDAMPDGGTLTIETQNIHLDDAYVGSHVEISPGHYVRITVTDTGTGMDDATMLRIFEPFFTTKDVGKGTGLGLSTVHGIIKRAGGDIQVYSEAGHGTTFKIYFPRADENAGVVTLASDQNENYSGTETILVVEDDETVRALVIEILTDNGYTVLEAADGEAALAICRGRTEPIHLLLTDVIMPQMSGPELSEQIEKLCPHIKVLFMSGYTGDAIPGTAALDSSTRFIEKPFTPDALAKKVREVIGS